MLHTLTIRNYAIIDSLSMEFSPAFHILTGETGAGKSIILGAFSLILGQRADTSVLREDSKKCVVEARFSEVPEHLKPLFIEEGLDWDPTETFIRREILPSGKSRAFINDTPVTLTILKEVGKYLVDLHRQHDNLSIADQKFQYHLLTTLGSAKNIFLEYSEQYNYWKKQQLELQKLIDEINQSKSELEFWQFNLSELQALDIQSATEFEDLEHQQHSLANADQIRETCTTALKLIEEGEFSVSSQLQQLIAELERSSKFLPQAQQLVERVNSVSIELQDIQEEISSLQSGIDANPDELATIDDRIGALRRAMMKHQQIDLHGLIEFKEELEQKVNSVQFADNHIAEKQEAIQQTESTLEDLNSQLLAARTSAKAHLEQHLSDKLEYVGMGHAKFNVEIKEMDEFEAFGKHAVKFLFSPNPGQALKPLHQVGSGGELSRLMVCIKHAVAGAMQLPTLFFDEVDTGISGEIAGKVGDLMHEMAENHQIISITHLPQMAARGTVQSFIYKEVSGNETYTRISELSSDQRVVEIAKMLSGEQPTEGALQNAKELLKL